MALTCIMPQTALLANGSKTYHLSLSDLNMEIKVNDDQLTEHFGPRFDRTAWISSIKVAGSEILGPWGLADEFGLLGDGVLGFDSAAISQPFVKIGIGELLRDSEASYSFSHPYPVKDLFPISASPVADELRVVQEAPEWATWPYRYQKTYRLLPDQRLVIDYELTNLGNEPWSFEHYNHHWFRLPDLPMGPQYSVTTDFELPDTETNLDKGPNHLRISTPLQPGEAQYYASELSNVPAASSQFVVKVDDHRLVEYTSSESANRFALYADPDGFCPEIFIRHTIDSGQTIRWSSEYRFFKPVMQSK